METRAHGHWQVVTVSDESQQQANQNVHDPTMNTPVEQSDIYGILGTLVIRVSGLKLKEKYTKKIFTQLKYYCSSSRKYTLVLLDYNERLVFFSISGYLIFLF